MNKVVPKIKKSVRSRLSVRAIPDKMEMGFLVWTTKAIGGDEVIRVVFCSITKGERVMGKVEEGLIPGEGDDFEPERGNDF